MTTSRAVVRPTAVRRKVEAWLAEDDETVAIALRARPDWTDDPVLTVAGHTFRVVACPTPIAVRAALRDRTGDERLVLLTELNERELGDGLLAHLSQHTVRTVDAWDLVRQAFGGQVRLDPALAATGRWAADALGDHAPTEGWPPPPGTVLTRDYALRTLASRLLGVGPEELDSAGLLQWSSNVPAQRGFGELPADLADGITGFLKEIAGVGAAPILAAARAGHGVDAIPLGLLAAVLWPREADPLPAADVEPGAGTGTGTPGSRRRSSGVESDVDILVARTRLEPRFGGLRLTQRQAAAFRDAAEAWLYRAVDAGAAPEAQRMAQRAEEIAAEIGIEDRLGASDLLPSGFTQRMRAFAVTVRLALPPAGTPLTGTVPASLVVKAQAALADVEAHRAARPDRVDRARMAVRLLRWLAAPDTPAPATLLDAVHRQVRQDSWVDRARTAVFAGDVDPQVAEAYRLLYRAVETRRVRHDEQFATLLARETDSDSEPGGLLRVEDLLDRVVAPILDRGRRVLLLVLDGMSTANAAEVAESVLRNPTWAELTPDGRHRTGVLAALPTVTEVNRCSLFSGRIAVGGQDAERKALRARFPGAVLLHKAGLRAGAGAVLDPEVTAALDDPAVPLVAAVLNTIDDALDRSDPGTTPWRTDTLRPLDDLLASARDRVVILVSDHGHVLDRGPEAVVRPAETADNRWQPGAATPGDGQLVFAGRRVALAGGRVVLPWREELRYGPRKAGYHGGASPAEAVIPLLVFATADETAVPGWAGAPVAAPDWWREPLAAQVGHDGQPRSAGDSDDRRPAGDKAHRPGRRRSTPVPSQAESLFELRPAEEAQTGENVPVVENVPAVGAPLVTAVSGPDRAPAPAGRSAPPTAAGPSRTGDAQPATVTAGGPAAGLADRLVASEIYRQRRGTRAPLPDERVVNMLTVLLAGGGRASLDTLAARAGIPAHRIHGSVVALRRLLQVEGYPVVTIDPDGATVKLDVPLMVEQFGLEER